MDAHDEKLARELAQQDVGIRRVFEKYSRLKFEVDELSTRAHLTPEEEQNRREFQKQKLAEKDKIVRMLEEHRRDQAGVSSAS